MKYLIVARHGAYHEDGLTERGRHQIAMLAQKLKSFAGGSMHVLTSTAQRARESAEILGCAFNVEPESHEVLWPEIRMDFRAVFELVNAHKNFDALIVVTHYEYVGNFTYYFGNKLGVSFYPEPIGNGEAWVIDCFEKTRTLVKP